MIYASVVARPIDFPAEIDISYEIVDRKTGQLLGASGADRCFSWEEIKQRFALNADDALACERELTQGKWALVAPLQEWESGSNPTGTRFGGGIDVFTFEFQIPDDSK